MNKQQLASKIWESANNMRSKIEANEYKDYILGFLFYKFLSDKLEETLRNEGWSQNDLDDLIDPNVTKGLTKQQSDEAYKIMLHCQQKLGYFISYENLFSTWLKKGESKAFDVSNVTDALSAFSRFIYKTDEIKVYENIFGGIFDTLQKGLDKLGDSQGSRTKAIIQLLELIKDIPTAEKDYDVLGFIYEYLISNFAANAGKKAGEFYTPHEASMIMAEIVSYELKNHKQIKIYDPTSGSGSLLINIGDAIAKYMQDRNQIQYYAQELKENTFNLTRMNLVMHGVIPENIIVRNGDTLADDWPWFDDKDKENTYEPLYVNAVVSNPPYSQKWEPINDSRFEKYGLAPESKADYAFLLHDLYHLQPDGIMTIVLPHGVLFRGDPNSGDGEGTIRKNLIENNNIDAIIGLPPNIFFGTGIPTIIMVLKQKRLNDDVLIIDASKGFQKEGKKNKLRQQDIKKIVDTYINRENIEKYSIKVSRNQIRENNYNLNIPRYINSNDPEESYDICSCMFGGISNLEIERFNCFWSSLPTLKSELFKKINDDYSDWKTNSINQTVLNNSDVNKFFEMFSTKLAGFDIYLEKLLLDDLPKVNIIDAKTKITDEIFKRTKSIPLIDKYQVYQLFVDIWSSISTDIEIIQTEGFKSIKTVEPNMVIKKKQGKDVEVQDGWKGKILPFELIWKNVDSLSKSKIDDLEDELSQNFASIDEIQNSISDDEKENYPDAFDEETNGFAKDSEIIKIAKTFKKITDPETVEYKIASAAKFMNINKNLKKKIKDLTAELIVKTKEYIESLSQEKCINFLKTKWINPIINSLNSVPHLTIVRFIHTLENLSNKYCLTLTELEKQISNSETTICSLIDDLNCDKHDRKGLEEFKKLLGGNNAK